MLRQAERINKKKLPANIVIPEKDNNQDPDLEKISKKKAKKQKKASF